MIVLTFLTVCQALKWSQNGEPLKKAERKQAKLQSKLEKSLARAHESNYVVGIGNWDYKLPFRGTVGRSKCSLRSENQGKCCDNTKVCRGCDPLLLARGFSCEEQESWERSFDSGWIRPDECHCSSSYG